MCRRCYVGMCRLPWFGKDCSGTMAKELGGTQIDTVTAYDVVGPQPVCRPRGSAIPAIVGEAHVTQLPAVGRSSMARHGQDVDGHRPTVALTMDALRW